MIKIQSDTSKADRSVDSHETAYRLLNGKLETSNKIFTLKFL
jgi:hypothetical protein